MYITNFQNQSGTVKFLTFRCLTALGDFCVRKLQPSKKLATNLIRIHCDRIFFFAEKGGFFRQKNYLQDTTILRH